MVTNGQLIVLVSETPLALEPKDDLTGMRNNGSLRQYFRLISQVTLKETAYSNVQNRINHHTIVVVESGFFADETERMKFKEKLEESGVPADQILFGENYASGYRHILLTIHELCK